MYVFKVVVGVELIYIYNFFNKKDLLFQEVKVELLV